ncbi:MAG: DUF2069 domain-containing protein [Salinisphaeraceae bacterium]|nr:DUF2069 domain-containing protein [Salinisphaeraceae bacterium]
MNPIRLTQALALAGQLGLIASLVGWFAIGAPSPIFGPWLALAWVAPLLPALPGMLRGRSYSFAWNSLVLMLYLLLGITELLSNPDEQVYALAVLMFTALCFIASQLYVRARGSRSRNSKQAVQGDST